MKHATIESETLLGLKYFFFAEIQTVRFNNSGGIEWRQRTPKDMSVGYPNRVIKQRLNTAFNEQKRFMPH